MALPRRARVLLVLLLAALSLAPAASALTSVSLSSGDIETAYTAFIARADKQVIWVTQNENIVVVATYSIVIPVGYTLYFNPSTVFKKLRRAYGSAPLFEVRAPTRPVQGG
jgi:hypothetical protein